MFRGLLVNASKSADGHRVDGSLRIPVIPGGHLLLRNPNPGQRHENDTSGVSQVPTVPCLSEIYLTFDA